MMRLLSYKEDVLHRAVAQAQVPARYSTVVVSSIVCISVFRVVIMFRVRLSNFDAM